MFYAITMKCSVGNGFPVPKHDEWQTLFFFPGRPSPVLKLKAIPVGVDQFKIQWHPPRQANGNLLGYKLTYREGTNNMDIDVKLPCRNVSNISFQCFLLLSFPVLSFSSGWPENGRRGGLHGENRPCCHIRSSL